VSSSGAEIFAAGPEGVKEEALAWVPGADR